MSTLRTAAFLAALAAAALAGTAVPGAASGSEPDGGRGTSHASVRVAGLDAHTRGILRTDPSARVDDTGRLYYVDPSVPDRAMTGTAAARAPFPYSQTFTLHSKPGSAHTIFLDFDGTHVAGTGWNDEGLPAGDYVGWDPSGNGYSTFSSSEQDVIQSVWQRVSEDYAPFDVDVTTQDPGDARLASAFASRALVTEDATAWQSLCDSGCGGIAYMGAFDLAGADHAYTQPAWIFTGGTTDEAKGIAEAVTHEVGHNMGLDHDGLGYQDPTHINTQLGYYEGHANWAPIMGASYYHPVSQWSHGEYSNAGNPLEDDVAVIAASTLGLRADEAGGTVATAAPLPPGTAFITSRTDTDTYLLGQCSGTLTVTASPATTGPDLDIALTLLDAGGTVVTTADPASGEADADTATGLAATISRSVSAGEYAVRVDGVGNGSPSSGYNDYGSLGAYTLTASGCSDSGTPTAPAAPTAAHAERDGATTATLSWSAPADDGGSPVTGYQVQLDDTGWVAVGTATGHQFTGVGTGAHQLSVRAVNAVGPGTAAQVSLAASGSLPGAVRDLAASVDAPSGAATVSWSAPASDGGSPLTGYEVALGDVVETFGPSVRSVSITGLTRGETVSVVVRAVNAAGAGPDTSVEVTVPTASPSAPVIGRASSGAPGRPVTMTLRWSAPLDDGGADIAGYQVYAYRLGSTGQVVATYITDAIDPSRRSVQLQVPRAGSYRLAVRAGNEVGWGSLSKRSNKVSAR